MTLYQPNTPNPPPHGLFPFDWPENGEPLTIRPHDGPVFVTPPLPVELGQTYRLRCAPDGQGSLFVALGQHEAEIRPGQERAFTTRRSLWNRVWAKLGGKPRLYWVPTV